MRPMPIPDHVAEIRPYVPGKPTEEVERELGLGGSVKLASNENPLGPSPRAVEALAGTLATLNRYPDGGGYYLRRRLSAQHNLPVEGITLGNGSTDLVEIFARTFLGAEGNAVMADQAFIMYRLAVMAVNGHARVVPLDADRRHDLPAMAAAVDGATRIMYIANPNNPTGTYVTQGEVVRLLEAVPDDVLVVIDEAYREYVVAPDYPDSIGLLKAGRRVAILRTFSKIHGLAGIRMGYALTTPDIVAASEKVRSPFNTNTLAQVAALAALEDTAHVDRSRTENTRERNFLESQLRTRGIAFVPSVANFVLVDVGRDGDEVFGALLRRGVIVRPMRAYNLPTCLRVTVGTRPENESFLRALAEVLGS